MRIKFSSKSKLFKSSFILAASIVGLMALYGPAIAETGKTQFMQPESTQAEPAQAETEQTGRAGSGELLFYPCTTCHPTTGGPEGRPNQFAGHQIKLFAHDKLGEGREACLVCHDSATNNPGMLKSIDGTLVPVDGDVARVCYRCHQDKYKAWEKGMHGRLPLDISTKYGGKISCVTKGCHDPHTPSWIAITPQPVMNTTFEVHAAGQRTPFKALTNFPNRPTPLYIPSVGVLAVLGFMTAGTCFAVPSLIKRKKR